MAIVDGTLRFYQGTVELYDTAHLIRRLEEMLANIKLRAEQSARDANGLRASLRKGIVALLAMRGVGLSPKALEKLDNCVDREELDRWFTRALIANSEAEVFSAGTG